MSQTLRAPDAGIDEDGAPVTAFDQGDLLPGGARAWERLGVGYRCETWLSWSDELFAPVVAKFPRPHQLAHPRARHSLTREVAALDGNLHPGLPRLYADGTAEHVPFVLTEHIDGLALDDELDERGALDDIEVAVLACGLLAALRSVHARGLVHVDIKPANVLLRAGRPVLIDFGSARRANALQPQGKLIGSPGYAAPELEAGAPIGPAMDVYGVGVTLHEALTGEAAFDPDLSAPDRPTPEIGDSAVAHTVARMLATDPCARPDLSTALHEFARLAEAAGRIVAPRCATAD